MYVIESANHGVYTGIDWSQSGNSYGPRFSYSIPRSDGWVFTTIEEARKGITQIRTFKHYAWKKQSWIDEIYILDLQTGKPVDVPPQRKAKTPFGENVTIIGNVNAHTVLVEHVNSTRETWPLKKLTLM